VRVRDLVLRPARIARAAPATAPPAVARNAVLASGYEDGLSEPELLLAIERVLGQPTPPCVAVATRGLEELIEAARADTATTEVAAGEAAHRAPRPGLATPHAAPADGAERTIAAAWEAMLEIDGIGADDNFFELGGHSLLLTRLLSRLRREHKIDVPLEPAFEAPTVRAWAAAAARAGAAPAKAPIRRVDRSKLKVPASDDAR
jgi:aryl carrier-like protein